MSSLEKPVSRETLYAEVWSKPVTEVAPRYGLSDVGLVKICKKLFIPVPGRGYWAKIRAGRPTRKLPLPALPEGIHTPLGPIPLTEEESVIHSRVRNVLVKTRQEQTPIIVPNELVDPLPMIRATGARLRQRDGWIEPSRVRSAPKEVLNIQVTQDCLDRALRFMDTLLKALQTNGLTARVDTEKGATLLVGRGTTLAIALVEQVIRTAHVPTPKEKRALDRYYASFRFGTQLERPNIPQFDWQATGRLTVSAGSYPSRNWNDTARSLIDARLPNIVATIVGLAEEKHAKEAEAAHRQRAYEKARNQYEAQVAALAEERRMLRELSRTANQMRRAAYLREFIDAFEQKAEKAQELTPDKQQWIAWARAKADWIDPLIRRHDPILDAPAPTPPAYRYF